MSNPTYPQSFDGIIQVASEIISTVSGVGTSSFTINPRGYPASFGGIVEVLSDLNLTTSGIEAGGGGASGITSLPGASETQSGILEIATQVEVDAGTDDFRAVTPLKLTNWVGNALPGTSETQSGIIELATQAEVDAGTDDFRAVTPLKLTNWTGNALPGASETQSGIIELATQVEVDAGTDDFRAVTPLKLTNWAGNALPGASETQSGILEIATQVEVDAGTDDFRAVTPLKLANSTSLVKRYYEDIGNAVDTSIVVNHNLGTRDVFVHVYRASGTYDVVYPLVNHTDANNVTVIYSVAPSSGEYRVVVGT